MGQTETERKEKTSIKDKMAIKPGKREKDRDVSKGEGGSKMNYLFP